MIMIKMNLYLCTYYIHRQTFETLYYHTYTYMNCTSIALRLLPGGERGEGVWRRTSTRT